MRDLMIAFIILGHVLLGPAAAAQQSAPPPCSGSEHRQFDFWLGTWDVFDSTGTLVGRNAITRELDGCVLHERWESARGPHRGAAGFPMARLLVLSPAGHFPFVEQPEVFFSAVDRFLAGEWPPRATPVEAGAPDSPAERVGRE